MKEEEMASQGSYFNFVDFAECKSIALGLLLVSAKRQFVLTYYNILAVFQNIVPFENGDR